MTASTSQPIDESQATTASQSVTAPQATTASQSVIAPQAAPASQSVIAPQAAPASQPDLIIGTAGHIDHGKSSLILALTGTDPDRLKEEKTRGITIELGFAQLELPGGITMGVVDVPGHERFVRQMIAGSTGVDIALLCIAADDGIMPQTEEHLAVLELLGITDCVVALTKTDLVDDEWVSFMKGEITQRLSTTSLAGSPIVPVSSRTGEGLEDLKATLLSVAQTATRTRTGTALRLPVDRVFTIKGSGTVITGTLWSGTARIGDEVEVLPGGQHTRIRGIQIHGIAHDEAPAGNRVALNLNAVSTDEIHPGDFLSTPGATCISDCFDAQLTYLGAPDSPKPLISGARVHIAHGTKEVIGRVLLLNAEGSTTTELRVGDTALVQIRLDEPLPVMWTDRFVIRSYSPVHVIGGGMVLRAHPKRTTNISTSTLALLEVLNRRDNAAIARTALELEPFPVSVNELARTSGLDAATLDPILQQLATATDIAQLGDISSPRYIMKRALQKLLSTMANELMSFHAEQPKATGISKENLRQICCPKCTEEAWDALLDQAVQAGIALQASGEVAHPTAGTAAAQALEQAANALEALITAGGKTPLTNGQLLQDTQLAPSEGYKALNALAEQGRAVKVGPDFYFAPAAYEELREAVREALANGEQATAADLRNVLGVSRKYAIPLLEHFDDIGLTRRDGDLRFLVQ